MTIQQRDIYAAICIFFLMFIYGIWLTYRSLRQIRQPTHIRDLGIGWFVKVLEGFSQQTDVDDLQEALSNPVSVRLAAGCMMLAGVFVIGISVVAWILLL